MSQPGNRTWTGVLYLKSGVQRQWELMKGECDRAGLGSHSVSLHWPPLYQSDKYTQLVAQQVQLLSHLGCLQMGCAEKLLKAVPSRRKESKSFCSAPSHLQSSSFTTQGVPSPNSKSGHPTPSMTAEKAHPSDAVTCCIQAWIRLRSQRPQGYSWPASGGKTGQAHTEPISLISSWGPGKQVRFGESDEVYKIILYNRSWN